MDKNKLEQKLIEHCAPTLAGMKSASLFSYYYAEQEPVREELSEVNRLLNERGVYVEALLWQEKFVLIYTYRLSHLERELCRPEAKELLEEYAYTNCNPRDCIEHLKRRLLCCACFPHEIGIFLGYPLEDVEGFIQNRGQNCKYCGMWKVYCNEKEKIQIFRKLKKCSEIYRQVFSEGRSLVQMTVCA